MAVRHMAYIFVRHRHQISGQRHQPHLCGQPHPRHGYCPPPPSSHRGSRNGFGDVNSEMSPQPDFDGGDQHFALLPGHTSWQGEHEEKAGHDPRLGQQQNGHVGADLRRRHRYGAFGFISTVSTPSILKMTFVYSRPSLIARSRFKSISLLLVDLGGNSGG